MRLSVRDLEPTDFGDLDWSGGAEHQRELAAARLAESEARAALVAARDRTKDLETRVAREADEVARLETRPGAGRARQRPGSAGS